MENFTPVSSLLGGLLIGLSATILWLSIGRVAGITGIFAGIIGFGVPAEERRWKLLFGLGLIFGGVVFFVVMPGRFSALLDRGWAATIVAGLLVGYGTRLSNGCTSGHGVCGLSRFRLRSLVATLTFIATGALTVYVTNRFFGGRL